METLIGILELVAWGAAVILLACGVTYAMIKLFPSRDDTPGPERAGDGSTS